MYKVNYRIKYLINGGYLEEHDTSCLLDACGKRNAAVDLARRYQDRDDVACVYIDEIVEVESAILQ
jgi:hypothetical protein